MAGKKRSLVTKTSPAKKNPRISKTPEEELVPLTIHIPKQHLAAFQAADMDDVIEFVNRGDIVKKLTQENNLHPIAEKIFQMLDQKSLVQARGVSRTWKNYVDEETSLWDELPIRKYFKAVVDERLDIIQNLVDYAKDKNPCDPIGWSVMHYAACKGKTNVMKILIRNAKNKNPRTKYARLRRNWKRLF